MPTRKRRIRPHEEPLEETGEWIPPPADPADVELDRAFSDLPQNEACIELFRVHQQGGAPRFLEQITPAMFNMAYVTEKFGGGKYQAKGYYKNGERRKISFDIEGDPFPVRRVAPKNQPDAPEMITPGVNRGWFQYQRERGHSEADPPPPADSSQAAMFAFMRALVNEMKGSETAVLEKLQLYKNLFAPPEKQEAPMEQLLNMFTRGVEMAGLAEGGGGPWWITILRELKEPLTKIVDTVQLSVQRSQPKPQPAPAPSPAGTLVPPVERATSGMVSPSVPHGTPEPLSPTPPMEPDQMMLLQLKTILPMLINGAARNTDTEFYVEVVLDQMPASGYDALRTWLMKPDCLEQLAAFEPGIRFQQEWWSSLRSGLLDALNEELGHAVRPLHADAPPKPATEPSPDHPDLDGAG